MITDKMSRLENILKEKTKHLDKLKTELSTLTKTSLENSKKLQNNGTYRLIFSWKVRVREYNAQI